MELFQSGGKDAPSLFILSTRAGGLGINLTAADTVIFYDQDWVGMLLLFVTDTSTEAWFSSAEPTNGRTSSGSRSSHWADEAGPHIQACE
jgi:hypothetical protein